MLRTLGSSRFNYWPSDWIQSCFGQNIKGIFLGGTAQNLQSELGVADLLPAHCVPAGVGHSG